MAFIRSIGAPQEEMDMDGSPEELRRATPETELDTRVM